MYKVIHSKPKIKSSYEAAKEPPFEIGKPFLIYQALRDQRVRPILFLFGVFLENLFLTKWKALGFFDVSKYKYTKGFSKYKGMFWIPQVFLDTLRIF